MAISDHGKTTTVKAVVIMVIVGFFFPGTMCIFYGLNNACHIQHLFDAWTIYPLLVATPRARQRRVLSWRRGARQRGESPPRDCAQRSMRLLWRQTRCARCACRSPRCASARASYPLLLRVDQAIGKNRRRIGEKYQWLAEKAAWRRTCIRAKQRYKISAAGISRHGDGGIAKDIEKNEHESGIK